MEYFSYSSLESFNKCPSQFSFRYIDKIKSNDESIEAFMGKRVHEALEYLYNEVLQNHFLFIDSINYNNHSTALEILKLNVCRKAYSSPRDNSILKSIISLPVKTRNTNNETQNIL